MKSKESTEPKTETAAQILAVPFELILALINVMTDALRKEVDSWPPSGKRSLWNRDVLTVLTLWSLSCLLADTKDGKFGAVATMGSLIALVEHWPEEVKKVMPADAVAMAQEYGAMDDLRVEVRVGPHGDGCDCGMDHDFDKVN